MLQNLNHLTLAVNDLDRSIVFYQQLPGLKLHARWDSGAYLTCGELWFCLSVDDSRHFLSPQESDYTHYAFSIAQEDVAAFIARLELANITCWKENKSEGLSYYFLDPDGHKLEAHVGNLAQRLAACRENPIREWYFLTDGRSGCARLIFRHAPLSPPLFLR